MPTSGIPLERKPLPIHIRAGKSAKKLTISHLILRSLFGIENAITPWQKKRLIKFLAARGFGDLEEQNRIAKAIYYKYRSFSGGTSVTAGADRVKEAADLKRLRAFWRALGVAEKEVLVRKPKKK